MGFLFLDALVAVFLVLALIKLLAWLVRGFGSEQTGMRADVGASPGAGGDRIRLRWTDGDA
jgi:hypothetical protein